MIVGHAPVAFVLAASLAVGLGVDRRRALALGLLAGAFAVVPDVDMAYAVVGLLGSDAVGVWSATAAFWGTASLVHRTITHSLVLAVPAATAFALLAGSRRARFVGLGLAMALIAVAAVSSGPLGVAMAGLYLVAGGAIGLIGARYGFSGSRTFVAAAVGLLSHPFGDLFTGTPPDMLYPLGGTLVADRVVLLADPTLNLLSAFGIELAALWLAIGLAARLAGVSLRERVHPPATAGVAYGLTALVLPAPTLDVSYHFVFSVLGVGIVGVAPLSAGLDRDVLVRSAITGLLAVTLGGAAFAAVYLVSGSFAA